MKIKKFKCINCGGNDFIFMPASHNPNVIGIYCRACGRFMKWANKDEKNIMKMGKASK